MVNNVEGCQQSWAYSCTDNLVNVVNQPSRTRRKSDSQPGAFRLQSIGSRSCVCDATATDNQTETLDTKQ